MIKQGGCVTISNVTSNVFKSVEVCFPRNLISIIFMYLITHSFLLSVLMLQYAF